LIKSQGITPFIKNKPDYTIFTFKFSKNLKIRENSGFFNSCIYATPYEKCDVFVIISLIFGLLST
tara:strand:+ start:445 stop:639 length:195 start_codon:yes stop_codon:yes gene_type:complete